jgi:hypothetical protein
MASNSYQQPPSLQQFIYGIGPFVISIIVIRFMVDQCPFLLEDLAQVDNNSFPF